ncbi:hypothetical protein ACU686_33020 [Yinghuangia aomiensis]
MHTLDAARRRATAVAVRGGRIVAVGHDADVHDLVGSGTEVVDLAAGPSSPVSRTHTSTRRSRA